MTNSKQSQNNQGQEEQRLYNTYTDRYHNLLKNVINQSTSMRSIDKEAYSVAITGGFGTGKTIFLKGLENYINKPSEKNCIAVYIDAQKFDYRDSPHEILATLLEDIALSCESNLKKRVTSVALDLRNIVPAEYKKLVQAVITLFKSNDEGKQKTVNENLCNFLSDDKFNHSVKMLQVKVLKIIQNSGQKFIFIIDELDRTSPAYSLKFLETVRHLLPINDIIFIFGINYNQMRAIVKSQYGIEDSDAATYFAKYFKHTYDLEAWQKTDFLAFYEEKFNYFFEALIPKDVFFDKHATELLNCRYQHHMCALFNLSLREMRDVVILLRENLLEWQDESRSYELKLYNFIVLMFLLCIKTKNPNLLEKIIQDRGDVDELLNYFLLLFDKAPNLRLSRKKGNLGYRSTYLLPTFGAIIEIIVYACDRFQSEKSVEKFYTIIQKICDQHGLINMAERDAEKSEYDQDDAYKLVKDSIKASEQAIIDYVHYQHTWFFYREGNEIIRSNQRLYTRHNPLVSLKAMATRVYS